MDLFSHYRTGDDIPFFIDFFLFAVGSFFSVGAFPDELNPLPPFLHRVSFILALRRSLYFLLPQTLIFSRKNEVNTILKNCVQPFNQHFH
jgi:hypothetical protein